MPVLAFGYVSLAFALYCKALALSVMDLSLSHWSRSSRAFCAHPVPLLLWNGCFLLSIAWQKSFSTRV